MTLFRPGEVIPRKYQFKTPGKNRRRLEPP
jgi:hypothetical protein